MHIVDIFDLPADFDPEAMGASGRRLLAELRTDASPLTALLSGLPGLAPQTAAITTYVLGGGRMRSEEAAVALGRVVLLALASETHADRLTMAEPDGDPTKLPDVARLHAIARGEADSGGGPLGGLVAELRRGMVGLPGWASCGSAFTAALQTLLDGVVQESRVREMARAASLGPAWAASGRATGLELVIEAACLAKGDRVRDRDPKAADFVSRLASELVALATDLGLHEQGRGDPRATLFISRRFAVADHLIRLEEKEIVRALRAITELELRDLLDGLSYLDPVEPRGAIVRRTVVATLRRQGLAEVIARDFTLQRPDRAEVMRGMREVARRDGAISPDERELLRGLDAHLFDFQTLVDRIERDRFVDFAEFQSLRANRMQILDDLFRIALADAEITGDERRLLVRAMELLPRLGHHR